MVTVQEHLVRDFAWEVVLATAKENATEAVKAIALALVACNVQVPVDKLVQMVAIRFVQDLAVVIAKVIAMEPVNTTV